jgi:hypothetical protein
MTDKIKKPFAGDPAELLIPVEEYCLGQLPKAFENFDEVILPLLDDDNGEYDVTVFYSRRKGITVPEHESLLRHNQHAFDAAKRIPGLVLYFQGHLEIQPDPKHLDRNLNLSFTPDCMSFCIWKSLKEAKAGAALPEHREAVSRVHQWYEGFEIKKYKLSVKTTTVKGKRQRVITFKEHERTV